ncbi:MAG: hypothetical protein AAGD43_07460 [Pseudomonadota bacterium]
MRLLTPLSVALLLEKSAPARPNIGLLTSLRQASLTMIANEFNDSQQWQLLAVEVAA